MFGVLAVLGIRSKCLARLPQALVEYVATTTEKFKLAMRTETDEDNTLVRNAANHCASTIDMAMDYMVKNASAKLAVVGGTLTRGPHLVHARADEENKHTTHRVHFAANTAEANKNPSNTWTMPFTCSAGCPSNGHHHMACAHIWAVLRTYKLCEGDTGLHQCQVLTMDRAYFVAGLNLVAQPLVVVPPSGDLGVHPLTLPRLKPAERAPRANANVRRGRSIGEAPSESTRPLKPLQPDTAVAIAAQAMLRDLQAGCMAIVLYDNKNQSELTYRCTDEAVTGHWRPVQTTHHMVYKSAEGSEYMQMKCMISGRPKSFALGRIEGALLLANDAAGITATASRAAALAAARAVDSNCQTHIGALVVAKTVRDDTVGGRGGQDGQVGGQEDGQEDGL
jgi:hypothetical protein